MAGLALGIYVPTLLRASTQPNGVTLVPIDVITMLTLCKNPCLLSRAVTHIGDWLGQTSHPCASFREQVLFSTLLYAVTRRQDTSSVECVCGLYSDQFPLYFTDLGALSLSWGR
jgi:hypothetical protein